MTLKKAERKTRYGEILGAMLNRRPDDAFNLLTKMYADDVSCYFLGSTPQLGWQPIETAPKDLGDRIEDFVLLSESGDVIHGGWYEEIDGEGVWFDRLYGEPIDDERITHWMLLPRPPKELEE